MLTVSLVENEEKSREFGIQMKGGSHLDLPLGQGGHGVRVVTENPPVLAEL